MKNAIAAPHRAVTLLFRALLVLMLAAVLTVVFSPTVALAADGEPAIVVDVSWPLVIGLLVSTILPLIVGLVTKYQTRPGVRAVLLAGLAALTGLLTELGNALTSGTTYNLGTGLLLALTAFLVAVGFHFGLLKPTGAADAAISVGSDTKGGI